MFGCLFVGVLGCLFIFLLVFDYLFAVVAFVGWFCCCCSVVVVVGCFLFVLFLGEGWGVVTVGKNEISDYKMYCCIFYIFTAYH